MHRPESTKTTTTRHPSMAEALVFVADVEDKQRADHVTQYEQEISALQEQINTKKRKIEALLRSLTKLEGSIFNVELELEEWEYVADKWVGSNKKIKSTDLHMQNITSTCEIAKGISAKGYSRGLLIPQMIVGDNIGNTQEFGYRVAESLFSEDVLDEYSLEFFDD